MLGQNSVTLALPVQAEPKKNAGTRGGQRSGPGGGRDSGRKGVSGQGRGSGERGARDANDNLIHSATTTPCTESPGQHGGVTLLCEECDIVFCHNHRFRHHHALEGGPSASSDRGTNSRRKELTNLTRADAKPQDKRLGRNHELEQGGSKPKESQGLLVENPS